MPTERASPLAAARLSSQGLLEPRARNPEEAVGLLCGVQAQEPAWARWSVGLRLQRVADSQVEAAIARGAIVRTWAFRGTLHYLKAEDARWVVALLAPLIIAGNQRRYSELGLDARELERASGVIGKSVQGEGPLTRAEIAARLEAAGIPAQGQRAPYMLQRAALEGIIRHGPQQGREPTYEAWRVAAPARAAGPAELAARYFAGHGPATTADFSWWSGLPAAQAREAAAAAGLTCSASGGRDLWSAGDARLTEPPPVVAHLLPPFDDFLLGYKDRGDLLDAAHARDVNAGGGMPKPAVLVSGRVAGTWSRVQRAGRVAVTARLFRRLAAGEQAALALAVRRYGEFVGAPAELA